MIVSEYISTSDIWVTFIDNGNKVHTNWKNFYDGVVRNVYDKNICNIGYIGEGDYKAVENRKMTPQYRVWSAMIRRCYHKDYHKVLPTYIECVVAAEWHNFQNFAKWYDENYYEIDGRRMELDKDILLKGNKIYSSDTCTFVPDNINKLFTKCDSSRGAMPIGIVFRENNTINPYIARCSDGKGKRIYIGHFSTVEEAFAAYKTFKEKVIKDIAEEYKELIPVKLYKAMIDYKVDIND